MDVTKGNTLNSLNLGTTGSNPTFSMSAQTQSSTTSLSGGNEIKTIAASEKKPLDKPVVPNTSSVNKTAAQSEAEGMAARFEDIYLRVSKDIEKVSNMGGKLASITKSEEASTKTVAHLSNPNIQWGLTDVKAFGELLASLSKSVSEDGPDIENTTQTVRLIIAETAKFMIKREETQSISESNGSYSDSTLNQRTLSEEAKLELDLLESRANAFNTMVQSLELNILENMKRSAFLEEDLSNYYSFNKKICDIQSEIKAKQNKLGNLEEKVGYIRMMDSSRKALKSSNGFSCIDMSDSDGEEEDISNAVLYTTKHIRRFNFFNTLYESTGQRVALSLKKQE